MVILTKDLSKYVGKEVDMKGWIYNKRGSGQILFLQFRDGYGFIQAVLERKNIEEAVFDNIKHLPVETSVSLKGIVSKHPKKDEYELQVSGIDIIHVCEEEYPITKKEHGPDFLLNNRHLWLRAKRQWAIQRVRNTIINATFEFLNDNNFIKIDSPIFTPNACEGTTTLFEVDYFDLDKVYLSQSGQLYIEAAIMSHGRVFDFGPVFRAEKSKTRRHLTEFWMMDAEMAFCDHESSMEIQERLISFIVQKVLDKNIYEMSILDRDIEPLKKIQPPFYRITHKEVIDIMREEGSKLEYDQDLGGDDETVFSQKYDKPVFVEKYPAKVKAFYMKRDSDNPEYALCSDMLAPEGYGEIIGGSQREENYGILVSRIKEEGLNKEDFLWYLDLRKYGSIPHSGFGYGLERVVAWLCGLKHVRETIPFPRMVHRKTP